MLSSAIEGIQTTLIDVFTQKLEEEEMRPSKETQLVLNYTESLDSALALMQQGVPLSSRIILKAHEILMADSSHANPGAYRKQMVQVGNLIPPPPPEISSLMNELENYIHNTSGESILIKTSLAHVQFETIHPFLDGNGRIGRLLIILMLIEHGILTSPMLYPSYYFKKHHQAYYQWLDRVRTHGDFEGWLLYYLKAMHESALDAYKRAEEIETLALQWQNLIQTNNRFTTIYDTAKMVLDFLFSQPIITINTLSTKLGKPYNVMQNVVQHLVAATILREGVEEKDNTMYYFDSYLALLEKEY